MKAFITVPIDLTFILSAILKAVNVYFFAQTINSFCNLLGLDGFYGYGVLIA